MESATKTPNGWRLDGDRGVVEFRGTPYGAEAIFHSRYPSYSDDEPCACRYVDFPCYAEAGTIYPESEAGKAFRSGDPHQIEAALRDAYRSMVADQKVS